MVKTWQCPLRFLHSAGTVLAKVLSSTQFVLGTSVLPLPRSPRQKRQHLGCSKAQQTGNWQGACVFLGRNRWKGVHLSLVPRQGPLIRIELCCFCRANASNTLNTLRHMGLMLIPVEVPQNHLTYFIEYCERAAAFDEFALEEHPLGKCRAQLIFIVLCLPKH